VAAIALAWFSALASFVLVVLVAVYYILENTPARVTLGSGESGSGDSGPAGSGPDSPR